MKKAILGYFPIVISAAGVIGNTVGRIRLSVCTPFPTCLTLRVAPSLAVFLDRNDIISNIGDGDATHNRVCGSQDACGCCRRWRRFRPVVLRDGRKGCRETCLVPAG